MKKFLALLLAALTVVSMAGCGGEGGQDVARLVMSTGGTTGTYYVIGGAMASQVNSLVPTVKITATASGASMENIRNISSGEADFAIVQNDVLDYASKGIELFEGEKKENISVAATLYPEICQVVVAKDSGINSIADLKGKRVSVGDVGSGVEANSRQILAAYGMSFDDIKASHLSFKESANSFRDGQIDAFFVTSGIPNTSITELSITNPVKLLSIDADKRTDLMANYPFYTEVIIPKDVYNTENDIETLGVMATLIVRSDLDDQIVYDTVKAIFDNLDALSAAHAKGKEFSVEKAVTGVTVDMHPGAVKYFTEKGVIK